MNFEDLKGKTFVSVGASDYQVDFRDTEGKKYRLYHDQQCCEDVYIESIVGDLGDLVGEPILLAEEVTSDEGPRGTTVTPKSTYNTYTWTFYKLATRKGYVDIRWYGESNGCYSEKAILRQVK